MTTRRKGMYTAPGDDATRPPASAPDPARTADDARPHPDKRPRVRPRGPAPPVELAEPLIALTLLRQRANLTQSELAERAGIHLTTLRRLEKRHARVGSIRYGTLERLADVLNVKPNDLLQDNESTILATPPRRVLDAEPGHLPERDVLDMFDVARLLRMSVKTFRRTFATRPDQCPRPLPMIDRSTRFARDTVERYLKGDPHARGGRRRA